MLGKVQVGEWGGWLWINLDPTAGPLAGYLDPAASLLEPYELFGTDPDKCIFEAAVYELYPEGEAPATEWTYTEPSDWPPVLQQDFTNMAAVQQGMKNAGFRGTLPNPYMERSIVSLHRNLAAYMGSGAPTLLS